MASLCARIAPTPIMAPSPALCASKSDLRVSYTKHTVTRNSQTTTRVQFATKRYLLNDGQKPKKDSAKSTNMTMNDEQIMTLAERWHAPNCGADAAGACICDSELKEAFVAGYKELLEEVRTLFESPPSTENCSCEPCRKIIEQAGIHKCSCGYVGLLAAAECACYDENRWYCSPTSCGSGCFHGAFYCPWCENGEISGFDILVEIRNHLIGSPDDTNAKPINEPEPYPEIVWEVPKQDELTLRLQRQVEQLRDLVAEIAEVTFLEPEQQELMREVGWNG